MTKLWGGRFASGVDPLAWQFNASISFDFRLAKVDIRGSKAWVKGLNKAGMLQEEELDLILEGLDKISLEIETSEFCILPTDEDVHTAIERRLMELAGSVGGKLHTGRSRNDQVATDLALWMIETLEGIESHIKTVQSSLINRSEKDFGVIMSGYTHLQQSQPILLSHWWLSHFWPLMRDRQRLADLKKRVSVLPLGSGAMAGTPYPIDRAYLAAELGLDSISPNSIDAVSNRDSAAEFLFIASMIAVHLSKLSEALILFSTAEFGYIRLSDAYTTGSSLMPQKKNPDTLELTRGKTGTIIGRLTGLLATLKGLPSSYDKDLQEDKIPVFETYDNLCLMLPVMAGLLDSLEVNAGRMISALNPAILSTDLADYLVAKGISFREAHALVGQAVRKSEDKHVPLHLLPLDDFQAINRAFTADVLDIFNFEKSISKRNLPGGTAPAAVQDQISLAKRIAGI